RSRQPRTGPLDRDVARRGGQMRTRLRELPRGARSRDSAAFLRWTACLPITRAERSGVAQWQSERLLTVRLWVRVPPPELSGGVAPNVGASRAAGLPWADRGRCSGSA